MLATVALKEFKPVITTAKGTLSSLTGGEIYRKGRREEVGWSYMSEHTLVSLSK